MHPSAARKRNGEQKGPNNKGMFRHGRTVTPCNVPDYPSARNCVKCCNVRGVGAISGVVVSSGARAISVVSRSARLIFTAVSFAGFFLGGLLLSWIVVPALALLSRDPQQRIRLCQGAVGKGFRLLLWFMRGSRLIRSDPTRFSLPEHGPAVVIANHPTLIDVVAILAANPRLCCVVKGNLFQMFFLGPLLRHCWHIDGGRRDSSSTHAILSGAQQRIAAGYSVLIFPEGTRSPEGGLRPLKRGAFEVAARSNVPVYPLYLSMAPSILGKQAPWYRVPVKCPRFDALPLPLMAPVRWNHDSRRMLLHATQAYEYCRARGTSEGWVWPDEVASEPLQELVA